MITLSKQAVSNKKAMKVLTIAEQDQLKKTIFEIHHDYISFLQEKYSKLTESDLLYLCLQETSLDSQSIAICFGYSDTHPLSQKKYRIKERMIEEKSKM